MNDTSASMVVEILVGGLQVTIWLTMVFLSLFGYTWIEPTAVEPWLGLVTLFVLGISYGFGVLFDRLWDRLLKGYDMKIRSRVFEQSKANHILLNHMRIRAFIESEAAAGYLDYIRSRIRIARASLCNFCLATAASVLFLSTRLRHLSSFPIVLAFAVGLGLMLTLLSAYAFTKTTETYYEQMLIANQYLSGKRV